jgi:Family of unknown function (DUF5367)
MKKARVISVGALIWFLIFSAFAILAYLPVTKDSLNAQALFVAILIIPFATFGASIYYKNGNKDHGFKVGLLMVIIAFLLDALITVPLLEIPNGRSYQSFFSYPLLYLLGFINMLTIYLYWKLKTSRHTKDQEF